MRASRGSRPASSSIRCTAASARAARGDRPRTDRARAGGRARVPEHPRPGRSGPRDEEALDVACRLATERRRRDRRARRGRGAARAAARRGDAAGGGRGKRAARLRADDRRLVRRRRDRAHRPRPPRRARDRPRGGAAEQRDHRHGAPRRRRAQAVFGGTTDYVLKQPRAACSSRPARRPHEHVSGRARRVFGLAFVGIGVALIVVTALHGGGVVGYLLGALFIAAGAGRMYLLGGRRG